ncbi:MAG: aminoglycoside phosphotransferase family protein [Candidatus Hydrothermarchaeota archaeon]
MPSEEFILSEFILSKEPMRKYLKDLFGEDISINEIIPLGAGCHGSGFLIDFNRGGKREKLVAKILEGGIGLGHDHFSDRAQVLLWQNDTFNKIPRHIKAIDVGGIAEDEIISIGKAKEFFLLMEEAKGKDYFHDLENLRKKEYPDDLDLARVKLLVEYLAELHSEKFDSKVLYWRKIRDTIGHGECLMGVLDTYPDVDFTNYEEMAEIEKKCIEWRAKLKPKYKRLCRIHGDFHPGNIWFTSDREFTILDRSRGEYGDAADDITAFTTNYIFYSITTHGKLKNPYEKLLSLFYDYYIELTGDHEIFSVVAPFYAFRGVVVASPIFYPDITEEHRRKLFNFVHGVLDSEEFSIKEINSYIKR